MSSPEFHEVPEPETLLQKACIVLEALLTAGYTREIRRQQDDISENVFLKYRHEGLTLLLEFADYRWRLEGVSVLVSLEDPEGNSYGLDDLQAAHPTTEQRDLWDWLEDLAHTHLQKDPGQLLSLVKQHHAVKLLHWQQEQEQDLQRYRKLALQIEEHPEGNIFLLPNTPEALGEDFWRFFPDHPTAVRQPYVWLVVCGLGELIASDHQSALDVLKGT
ncbi:hypothetical protein [Deinococcus roseus]|uniref:Uncharacterized protein n=1 Tax=Deinococcus roseus TaxID=392414 RepID=A0ABQ2CVZ8_9DEIO|nr:hypothetical protein [Deinococcus roseus]GGJ22443.1 hypothetical protein GCM10008938_05900 [Deinococcus roseus]